MLPIGDTLFLTPTLRALRARYPAARLTGLAYASNAPLLRCAAEVDEVVEMPNLSGVHALGQYAALLSKLRRQKFDVAVDFTSPAFMWIAIAAGVRRRTSMKFDAGWWWRPGGHETWRSTHATRLYYDCAAELDLPPWETTDQRPRVDIPTAAREEVVAYLAREEVSRMSAPIVALHPGGKGLSGQKRWDPDHFAVVADALHTRWRAQVLLLGGRDEQALVGEVAARMTCPSVLAAGQLSLLGTIALLGQCDLFVGNDSSLLHLAACQATPYVGIYGPTCLANFQPIAQEPRQGRLAVAWPPSPREGYFVGARPIWQWTPPRDARAALSTVSASLVLSFANELLERGR